MSGLIIENISNISFEQEKIERRLHDYWGHPGKFNDDKWIGTNLKGYSLVKKNKYTLIFSGIPKQYKEETKLYFINIKKAISSMKSDLCYLRIFFRYLNNVYDGCSLINVNYNVLNNYADYIIKDLPHSKEAKQNIWNKCITFFTILQSCPNVAQITNFPTLKIKDNKIKSQVTGEERVGNYIPQKYMHLLDEVMIKHKNDTPVHIQTVYWILRLIPNRINEVLDMTSNECLRKFGDKYILTIPSPKTSSTGIESKKKMLFLTGKSKTEEFLIDLINKQIKNARLALETQKSTLIQGSFDETDYLFRTYSYGLRGKKLFKYYRYNVILDRYSKDVFTLAINRIIKHAELEGYNFKDSNNKTMRFNTHCFRHEGITDRLDYGFSTQDVMFLAGIEEDETIYSSYYHATEKEAYRQSKLQGRIYKASDEASKLVTTIKEDNEQGNDDIKFLGNAKLNKILLNMNSKIKHHFPIIDAYGNHLGNCTDIYNCKKIEDKSQCLKCDHCIKDIVNIDNIKKAVEYFREEYKFLKEKGSVRQLQFVKRMLENYESILKQQGE